MRKSPQVALRGAESAYLCPSTEANSILVPTAQSNPGLGTTGTSFDPGQLSADSSFVFFNNLSD